MDLTYEEANKYLRYDPDTGNIYRKINSAKAKSGDEAGCINGAGYKVFSVKGKIRYAHRVAWLLHHGEWPKLGIDHINGDCSDNRIENLRDVQQNQNMKNACRRSDNKSGFTGVTWCKAVQKWRATIKVDGRSKSLGCFKEKLPAIFARIKAEPLYGYHPNHGRS